LVSKELNFQGIPCFRIQGASNRICEGLGREHQINLFSSKKRKRKRKRKMKRKREKKKGKEKVKRKGTDIVSHFSTIV